MRRARRRRNPSKALAVIGGTASALAPLLPYVLLAGVGYYLWRRFRDSALGGAAAHAATAVPDAYKQAVAYAADPNAWPVVYEQAEKAWAASGGEGNPIAQPYYGPAGEW
jgi:hypothetical protein